MKFIIVIGNKTKFNSQNVFSLIFSVPQRYDTAFSFCCRIMSKNTLLKNEELQRGEHLMSNNGRWKAVFQVSKLDYFVF